VFFELTVPPGPYHSEWLLLGTIYRAGIATYLTLSLPSCSPPHNSHSDTLLSSLRIALKSPQLFKFLLWPLVVAGVACIHDGETTRNWVERSLEDMGRTVGSSGPNKAGKVLRAHWERGIEGWDACFQRPYVFVV
jgi:hypothetical protein